jgi:hypothetical protein
MPKSVLAALGMLLGLAVGDGVALAQDDMFMPGVIGAEQGMSAVDFDTARMSFFNRSDANGDLVLSPGELNQALAHEGSTLFGGRDLDGDGGISLEEYMLSGNDLFAELDADGDGILSSGEM